MTTTKRHVGVGPSLPYGFLLARLYLDSYPERMMPSFVITLDYFLVQSKEYSNGINLSVPSITLFVLNKSSSIVLLTLKSNILFV